MSNKGGRVSPDYLADIAPEYATCIAIIATLFILIKFIDFTKLGGTKSIIGYGIIILAAVWGLLNHCGIIPKKFDIIDRLTNWLYKMISNFFEKE